MVDYEYGENSDGEYEYEYCENSDGEYEYEYGGNSDGEYMYEYESVLVLILVPNLGIYDAVPPNFVETILEYTKEARGRHIEFIRLNHYDMGNCVKILMSQSNRNARKQPAIPL